MVWFFLLSGLFLGWSLGANDAANVFGTAVGTKMVKFKTAAILASIFVILGAVISGAGASHTLGKLGAVNALAGAFTVALAAAITVSWMTKMGLPVSTTQAIVGAIMGWTFFTGSLIDMHSLTTIVSTWVICPLLAGFFSFVLYKTIKPIFVRSGLHLLEQDLYTRIGLILVGVFGSYSLGANNIANVMGVFVESNPFSDLKIYNLFTLSATQVLFLIGGLAIAVGIFTYSYKVMKTVGNDLFRLSPIAALIVVFSESLVLFLFASQSFANFLISLNIPPIPLVPVSSSQAIVGGVMGIGLAKGGRGLNYKMLLRIVWGWILTPTVAAIISFTMLFFMQNVFQQDVFHTIEYKVTPYVVERYNNNSVLKEIEGMSFTRAIDLKDILEQRTDFSSDKIYKIVNDCRIDTIKIDSLRINSFDFDKNLFNESELKNIKELDGKVFIHKWLLEEKLATMSNVWVERKNTGEGVWYNKKLKKKIDYIYRFFKQEDK